MMKRIKDDSGSVVIEATISLSAFMFAIITLLTIVNICVVQAKVSIAINATAKELSHYSYLYSLTGIPGGQAKLADAAAETEKGINDVLSDVNTVFTEIQNIGKDVREEAQDITTMLENIESSGKNITDASGSLKRQLEELAKDPKGVAMGLVKIAATDGFNFAMSRLIADPLSRGLCKKNLVPQKGGNIETYLKYLGVVPAANGSYYDGLDFSKSTIFPDGSNEIRVTVSYDVKVVALLPIDFSFHFTQTAVTHGWLAGEDSYRSTSKALDKEENSNIWTKGTIAERSDLIRHQGIKDYTKKGYVQVAGRSFSDVHVYNSETNEFVAFHSMNPLYSAEGEDTLTLADISDVAIKEQLEYLCAGIDDSTKNLKTVQTKKKDSDGKPLEYKCENSTQKIVLVIPEDEGLKEKIQSIVDTCNTRGVAIELLPSYGNGARTTVVSNEGGVEE